MVENSRPGALAVTMRLLSVVTLTWSSSFAPISARRKKLQLADPNKVATLHLPHKRSTMASRETHLISPSR
jgi:hypothetical protein